MKKIICLCLFAVCLTACGKKGNLEFHKDSAFPRQYPMKQNPKQMP